jgi:hypothetical protein
MTVLICGAMMALQYRFPHPLYAYFMGKNHWKFQDIFSSLLSAAEMHHIIPALIEG